MLTRLHPSQVERGSRKACSSAKLCALRQCASLPCRSCYFMGKENRLILRKRHAVLSCVYCPSAAAHVVNRTLRGTPCRASHSREAVALERCVLTEHGTTQNAARYRPIAHSPGHSEGGTQLSINVSLFGFQAHDRFALYLPGVSLIAVSMKVMPSQWCQAHICCPQPVGHKP